MEYIEDHNEEEFEEIQNFDQIIDEEKEERRKLAKKLKDEAGEYVPVVMTKNRGLQSVNDLNYEEQADEIVRCTLDPIYFIETYLTIFDQTQGEDGEIVSFKLFPFQKRLIKAYEDHRFNIANKYRQAGISTTTCAYIAWYVMFNANRVVAIVANKLETARDELMYDVVEFIDGCPDFLKPKPEKKDTAHHKRYDNGSELKSFSSKGLRGPTPTLVFWDETAWTEKSDKFWEGTYPSLQTGGRAILVSTPNGLDPVFYKTFDSARNKDEKSRNKFNAVELWWFNDPRYIRNQETKEVDLVWVKNKGRDDEIILKDENWTDEKRIQMMDDGWEASSSWFEDQVSNANGNMRKIAQELLCSFLGSGDNFIAEEVLKRIDDHELKTPIREEYLDKNMWIWEDPLEAEDYLITVDVSSGHGEDYCTINILKINEFVEERVVRKHGRSKKVKVRLHKAEQVAEYYGKVTPKELGEITYIYGKKYNDAYATIDVTGGLGVETINKLFELGYDESRVHFSEITHKPTRARLNGYVKTIQKTLPDGKVSKVDILPGFFISGNRGSMLVEMERAIRMKEIVVRSARLHGEFKTFVTVTGNRVADHKRSYHDDSIMSLAIGIYVMNFEMKSLNHSPSKTKKILDAMMRIDSNAVVKKVKEEGKEKQKYVVEKRNPYGQHAWLFSGLDKRR